MFKKLLVGCCVMGLAGAASAADKPVKPAGEKAEKMEKMDKKDEKAAAAGMPDMSKMGPMSRKVMHEADDKKGVDALYKAWEDAMKKGDPEAMAALLDFPVFMITDDSKGEVKTEMADHDKWMKEMGEFVKNTPKDMKMSSKHTAHFLSDTLASVDEDNSMSMGKMKGAWKSHALAVNKNGKWMFKSMAEAGWGDMATGTQAAADQGKAMGAAGK